MPNAAQTRDSAGRWTEMVHADPGQLALDAGTLDLGSNLEGSFEFPPFLGDAAQIVQFWTNVDIPEEVLVATVAAYDARLAIHARRMWAEWEIQHPKPTPNSAEFPAWQAQALAWAKPQLPFPESIPPQWVRPLVRVTKMVEASRYLDGSRGNDKAAVNGLNVTFPGGQQHTVQQWVDLYGSSELLPLMNDYTRRAAAFEVAHQAVDHMG